MRRSICSSVFRQTVSTYVDYDVVVSTVCVLYAVEYSYKKSARSLHAFKSNSDCQQFCLLAAAESALTH